MKKNLFRLLAMLLVLSAVAVSCKKETTDDEDTTPTPTPVVTLSFSCKINGTAYSATTNASFNTSSGIMLISLPFTGAGVTLNVPSATGNVTFSGFYAGGVNMGSSSYSTAFTGGSGSCNISAYSATETSGTFSFIAKTSNGALTATVTEGKFTKVPHV